MSLPTGLLSDVKNNLHITWYDQDDDRRIEGIVSRGIRYLDRVAGAEYDYTVEDKPRELLMEYCRYVNSNALQYFTENFREELISLQNGEVLGHYEQAKKQP